MLALLTKAPYPARNPAQNIADLKAQVAANEKGVAELRKMVRRYGLGTVRAYMGHVQDNAAEAVARVIAKLKTSRFEVETDQGSLIKVAITIDRKAQKGRGRFHRHERASRRTTSTRRSRSRALACSMSSARWSTTTSR